MFIPTIDFISSTAVQEAQTLTVSSILSFQVIYLYSCHFTAGLFVSPHHSLLADMQYSQHACFIIAFQKNTHMTVQSSIQFTCISTCSYFKLLLSKRFSFSLVHFSLEQAVTTKTGRLFSWSIHTQKLGWLVQYLSKQVRFFMSNFSMFGIPQEFVLVLCFLFFVLISLYNWPIV